MDKQIIIIGAGISGLSLAWKLASSGVCVGILESNSCVGGLSRTINRGDYHFDIGPHTIFTEKEQVVKTILDFLDYPLESKCRKVKLFYKNKYLDYPLTLQGILTQMGFIEGVCALVSYIKGKVLPYQSSTLGTEQETIEDWAISNFGKHLYGTFFRPYTEHFWKMPCNKLSSQSIPSHTKMGFLRTLFLLIGKKIVRNSVSVVEREALPTYCLPHGFGEIAENIAKEIKRLGGEIYLNCESTTITKLSNRKVRVTYLNKGRQKNIVGEYIVSTMPLSSLIKIMVPKPSPNILVSANMLDYKPLVLLYLVTEKQNILGCWYTYMLNRPYNRISELNQFSPQTSPDKENILMIEIPCSKKDSVWNASKEYVFDMCIEGLSEDGFIHRDDVKKIFMAKIPAAYPIYCRDYIRHLNKLLSCIKNYELLDTLGRSGEFRYMDIDQCMERAFNRANSILQKGW